MILRPARKQEDERDRMYWRRLTMTNNSSSQHEAVQVPMLLHDSRNRTPPRARGRARSKACSKIIRHTSRANVAKHSARRRLVSPDHRVCPRPPGRLSLSVSFYA
eukprot:6205647-Pleurochrysis_carterae.AAC.1